MTKKKKEGAVKLKYEEKFYIFLDSLRETGKTNMFGAGAYLKDEFPGLSASVANKILADWMDTFSARLWKKLNERGNKHGYNGSHYKKRDPQRCDSGGHTGRLSAARLGMGRASEN